MAGLKTLFGDVCGFASDVITAAKPLGKAVNDTALAAQASATQLLLAVAPTKEELAQAAEVRKLLNEQN